jgi:hypothetical protein
VKEQLTREKILNAIMNKYPGKDLDALVARDVMGYTDVRNVLYPEGWSTWGIKQGADDIRMVPPYSTDLSAAWEVEEKVIKTDSLKYIAALMQVLWNDTDYIRDRSPDAMLEWSSIVELIQATPEQRCKAALLTTLEEVKA